VLPLLLPFLPRIHVGGEQHADRVDDDGLVRDVTVDGAVVVIVLPCTHLLSSHGPDGGPHLRGCSRPEQSPLIGAELGGPEHGRC
jgi:hypothetical protein